MLAKLVGDDLDPDRMEVRDDIHDQVVLVLPNHAGRTRLREQLRVDPHAKLVGVDEFTRAGLHVEGLQHDAARRDPGQFDVWADVRAQRGVAQGDAIGLSRGRNRPGDSLAESRPQQDALYDRRAAGVNGTRVDDGDARIVPRNADEHPLVACGKWAGDQRDDPAVERDAVDRLRGVFVRGHDQQPGEIGARHKEMLLIGADRQRLRTGARAEANRPHLRVVAGLEDLDGIIIGARHV